MIGKMTPMKSRFQNPFPLTILLLGVLIGLPTPPLLAAGSFNSVTETSEPWLGIEVLVYGDSDAKALMAEVPKLAEQGVNALVIEINYRFKFQSHPELRQEPALSMEMAHALAKRCRSHGITPIPLFNCLGHQSWEEKTFPLLKEYPELDETPGAYPNNEEIYCRSWCPQHPKVNGIVFDLFTDLIEAFDAKAFHVGMDEVFLIGSKHCPRCRDDDPADLFAEAVNDYHDFLVEKHGLVMLMWGDRLLNAEKMGYSRWEASKNGTHGAIDDIPKDIIICDWHYGTRKKYPSIPFFLERGFRVWPAGYDSVPATEALIQSAKQHNDRNMLGHLSTTWGSVEIEMLAEWPPIKTALRAWQ